jgi:hypothetical protein
MLALSGCGGISNFTGGGFPIGKSRLAGRVVRAESPLVAVPAASVTLTVSPGTAQERVYSILAGDDGTFAFESVPTGDGSVSVQVTITPRDAETRAQHLSFLLTRDKEATLIAALPRTSVDLKQGVSVSITPNNYTAPQGSSVPFRAEVKDSDGKTLPLAPSLLFTGSFTTIRTDGTVYGVDTANGSIVAFWNDTLVSNLLSVVVDDTIKPGDVPPPPPVLPLLYRVKQTTTQNTSEPP